MGRAILLALPLAVLLVWPGDAPAHDGDVATFVLEPVQARAGDRQVTGWVMRVHVAQHALAAVAGGGAIDAAFKSRAVAYVKRHVRLTLGGKPLALGAGGIRVGGHQTDFKFAVAGLPGAGGEVAVEIDAFAEDGHQSNVLKLRGAVQRTVVLRPDNGFAATVKLAR